MKNKDTCVHNLRLDFHMTQRTLAPVRFSDGLTGARFSFSLFERSLLEEGPDELRGVEWLEVFHLFSDTDIPYGNAQLLLNAYDHAPLRRAIEFGQYDAADIRRFFENPGLLEPVLPGRSIQH